MGPPTSLTDTSSRSTWLKWCWPTLLPPSRSFWSPHWPSPMGKWRARDSVSRILPGQTSGEDIKVNIITLTWRKPFACHSYCACRGSPGHTAGQPGPSGHQGTMRAAGGFVGIVSSQESWCWEVLRLSAFLCRWSVFPLAALKSFSLHLIMWNFIMMRLGEDFFICILRPLGLPESMDHCIVSCHFWKILSKYLLPHSLFLFLELQC